MRRERARGGAIPGGAGRGSGREGVGGGNSWPQAAMASDQGLQQTIGWEDYNQAGANGTFDPLAN